MNENIRHATPNGMHIEIASNQDICETYINSHIGLYDLIYRWEIDIFTLENRLKFKHMKQVCYNI